jgi:hypothetical protein
MRREGVGTFQAIALNEHHHFIPAKPYWLMDFFMGMTVPIDKTLEAGTAQLTSSNLHLQTDWGLARRISGKMDSKHYQISKNA